MINEVYLCTKRGDSLKKINVFSYPRILSICLSFRNRSALQLYTNATISTLFISKEKLRCKSSDQVNNEIREQDIEFS